MKTLTLATLILLSAGAARAWEFPLNPDRFPSLGVAYDVAKVAGDRADTDNPANPALVRTQTDRLEASNSVATADFRLPVSNQVTFTFTASSLWGDAQLHRQGDVYRENGSVTGYRFGFGARLYFNK